MKEGGTSLNKTFREYNLVFKGLNLSIRCLLPMCSCSKKSLVGIGCFPLEENAKM